MVIYGYLPQISCPWHLFLQFTIGLTFSFALGYLNYSYWAGFGCASNWETYGEFCYYVDTRQEYTYDQARSACEAENATLTSIHSTEEQAFHARELFEYSILLKGLGHIIIIIIELAQFIPVQ